MEKEQADLVTLINSYDDAHEIYREKTKGMFLDDKEDPPEPPVIGSEGFKQLFSPSGGRTSPP